MATFVKNSGGVKKKPMIILKEFFFVFTVLIYTLKAAIVNFQHIHIRLRPLHSKRVSIALFQNHVVFCFTTGQL